MNSKPTAKSLAVFLDEDKQTMFQDLRVSLNNRITEDTCNEDAKIQRLNNSDSILEVEDRNDLPKDVNVSHLDLADGKATRPPRGRPASSSSDEEQEQKTVVLVHHHHHHHHHHRRNRSKGTKEDPASLGESSNGSHRVRNRTSRSGRSSTDRRTSRSLSPKVPSHSRERIPRPSSSSRHGSKSPKPPRHNSRAEPAFRRTATVDSEAAKAIARPQAGFRRAKTTGEVPVSGERVRRPHTHGHRPHRHTVAGVQRKKSQDDMQVPARHRHSESCTTRGHSHMHKCRSRRHRGHHGSDILRNQLEHGLELQDELVQYEEANCNCSHGSLDSLEEEGTDSSDSEDELEDNSSSRISVLLNKPFAAASMAPRLVTGTAVVAAKTTVAATATAAKTCTKTTVAATTTAAKTTVAATATATAAATATGKAVASGAQATANVITKGATAAFKMVPGLNSSQRDLKQYEGFDDFASTEYLLRTSVLEVDP